MSQNHSASFRNIQILLIEIESFSSKGSTASEIIHANRNYYTKLQERKSNSIFDLTYQLQVFSLALSKTKFSLCILARMTTETKHFLWFAGNFAKFDVIKISKYW